MVAAAAIGGEVLGGAVGADALGAVAIDGLAGDAIGGFAADAAGGFAGSDAAFGAAMDGGYGGAGYAGGDAAFNAANGAGGGGWSPSFGNLAQGLGGLGGMAKGLGTAGAGMMNGNAAVRAAQIQADAANQSIALQRDMFDKSQANLAPFMQGGNTALASLSGKFADGSLGGNFTGADYLANKDPGYEFQLAQGNQALQNSQAARDGVMSGPAMKGLIDYNQGMASTGYQNAYSRWLSTQQNTFGQLRDTAAIGANAAGGMATNSQKFSTGIGNTIEGRGNVLGSGVVGQANNYSKALDGVGSQMYALRDMVGSGGGGGGSSYDSGFNGQNNPQNQAGLDKLMEQYA